MLGNAVKILLNRSLRPSSSVPVQQAYRLFSAAPPTRPRIPIQVTFPQVRKELSKPETILIDVREPAELGKEGRISQNAKNIPLGQLEAAFQLSDAEFETKYGFPKPTEDQTIVTHCKLGIRATKGAMALSKAGFLNVLVYPGTVDWAENGGDLIK